MIVWNIDSERTALGCKANYVKRCKIWGHERILLHLPRPWKLWYDAFWVDDKRLELLWLFFVNYWHKALVVSSCVLWVQILLDPAHAALHSRRLVSNPSSLGIFVSFYRPSLVRLDILFNHGALVCICGVIQSYLQILVNLEQVGLKLSKLHLENLIFKLHAAILFSRNTGHG